ncbi:hypothetical protein CARG_03285 [Corynebacterium argentoratense DSM 44202]|uniref:Uncharacterized protein n=1 Tax=Corynebacterium argentoratense DSM 44202 TaxID=1348662 RepID=U3GU10_9CORY|nr:hypothetical protein CARG_03285 [Corynebacterium argentoratense DSM 44202]
MGRRYELAVPDGAGRRYELAVPGRQSPGWHSLQSATGAGAMPVPGFAKQGAVLGQQMRRGRTVCSLQLATGAGLMPVPGEGALGDACKMHWFWQICTWHSHFPRSLFLKVQICPNQCTHPTHAPHAPHPRPRRTPLTPHPQMPNRTKNRQIYLPLPYFRRSLSPKTQICRFFVLSSKNHRRMTLKKACPETTLESGQAFCCEKLSY